MPVLPETRTESNTGLLEQTEEGSITQSQTPLNAKEKRLHQMKAQAVEDITNIRDITKYVLEAKRRGLKPDDEDKGAMRINLEKI